MKFITTKLSTLIMGAALSLLSSGVYAQIVVAAVSPPRSVVAPILLTIPGACAGPVEVYAEGQSPLLLNVSEGGTTFPLTGAKGEPVTVTEIQSSKCNLNGTLVLKPRAEAYVLGVKPTLKSGANDLEVGGGELMQLQLE